MADYGQSSSTLATTLEQDGKSPQTVSSALETNARGSLSEGQQPATGLVKAWGAGMSTAVAPFLLPSEATVGSILGAGAVSGAANLSNQIASGGPVSTTDALVSTGIGAVTQGRGFWFTEAAGIAGAYGEAKLQGRDPVPAVAGAAVGNLVGFSGGKAVEAGNKYYPLVSGKVAEKVGAIGGAVASETTSSKVEYALKSARGK
ncbi:hypothetical protein S518_003441 [Salmonella enterica subsp. enterica]|nr:hypothetical protein [Salmonella enterica subsp. enterica]EIE6438385.1 hypothetical protein [Salmonella enterica]EIG1434199.1 hypothetical protein [Salmonella enterica]EIG1438880.1 hypothetical protein [Salmonella enterica]ELP2194529.1 hypothetical protein [Salmonella enterica subsp. enterica serovar Champaign]